MQVNFKTFKKDIKFNFKLRSAATWAYKGKVAFKLFPPTRKEGALGFFALKNNKILGKNIAPYKLIGKMKLKNFPRFGEFLKNKIYFEKLDLPTFCYFSPKKKTFLNFNFSETVIHRATKQIYIDQK